MELCACRAFILRDEAEAALVFSRAQLIGPWSWETLSCVLKARVLSCLWSQCIHKALMQLLRCLKIILSWSGNYGVDANVLLKILLLEVVA